MTFDEFDKQFTKQIQAIDGLVLNGIDDKVYQFIVEYVYENVNVKGGNLIIDESTIIAIRKLGNKLSEYLSKDSEVNDFAKKIISEIISASNIQNSFFSSNNTPNNNTTIKGNLALIADNLSSTFNTLGTDIIIPIKQIIVKGLSVGISKSQLEQQLKEHLKLNGPQPLISRYLNTYSSYAADAYTGTVNQQQFNQYKSKISAIRITGTIIKTSSPQCRKCIKDYNKLIPIDDFKKVIIPLAQDNGLIKGTTIENVFVNKLHYACRHNFTPII